MSALPAAQEANTVRSGRYLNDLFKPPNGRVAKNDKQTPDDPAILEFYAEIGARVRSAREAKGWRREDLANALGVGFRSVQNYEQGEITLGRITQLAEVLDVTPRWLLHGDRALQEQLGALLEASLRQDEHLRRLLGENQGQGSV